MPIYELKVDIDNDWEHVYEDPAISVPVFLNETFIGETALTDSGAYPIEANDSLYEKLIQNQLMPDLVLADHRSENPQQHKKIVRINLVPNVIS